MKLWRASEQHDVWIPTDGVEVPFGVGEMIEVYPVSLSVATGVLSTNGWRQGKDGLWRTDAIGGAYSTFNALRLIALGERQ